MYIDTHNHFSYRYKSEQYSEAVLEARRAGVGMQIVMPGHVNDFDEVKKIAHQEHLGYMLGLHPLMIAQVGEPEKAILQKCLETACKDLRFIGIGEIGLDRYMDKPLFDCQKALFIYQMQLAELYGLPVSVHSRRSLSFVLDLAKAFPKVKGVLHAFKGSLEQTRQAIDLGWKLGIGGAVSYEGSKAVRGVVKYANIEAFVLESDSPDMAPAGRYPRISDPTDIIAYALILADLKNIAPKVCQRQLLVNTLSIFPRLEPLLQVDKLLIE